MSKASETSKAVAGETIAIAMPWLLIIGGGALALYLIREELAKSGGLIKWLEGLLLPGDPKEKSTKVPNVPHPPPPGTPTLPEVIPFTGAVLDPASRGVVKTGLGSDHYTVTLLIQNNTNDDATGPIEIQAVETGTYGGVENVNHVWEDVTVPALGAIHQTLNVPTTAGSGTYSETDASFYFNGHHIATTHYTVE